MQIDDLERLARLRDQGVLTDQEFEQQKAKLLSDNPQQEETYEDYEDIPRRRSRIAALKYVLLGAGGLALLYLVGWFDEPSSAPAAVTSGSSDWDFSTATDPMTDTEIVSARKRFNASPFYVDAAVNCVGSSRPTYEFAVYDSNNNPAALRRSVERNGTQWQTFRMRIGGEKAETYFSQQSKYANTIAISPTSGSLFGIIDADSVKVAQASRVVLTLPLVNGEATLTINQQDSALRALLDQCLAARDAQTQSIAPSTSDAPDNVADEPTPEATPPSLPKFSDYSVEVSTAVSPLKLQHGSWFWDYRTRIQNAYSSDPNFAGNAIVTLWGCGTGCRFGALVDRVTGDVQDIPLGGEDNMYLDVRSERGSNLLLATWEDGSGDAAKCVFEALVWNGKQFSSVGGYPVRVGGTCPVPNDE